MISFQTKKIKPRLSINKFCIYRTTAIVNFFNFFIICRFLFLFSYEKTFYYFYLVIFQKSFDSFVRLAEKLKLHNYMKLKKR